MRIDASGRKARGRWVHLDGLGSLQGLSEAHKVGGRNASDEHALENAIEGY